MPSQSPSPTTTIQTLPSDQQQQQEYVDTLNSEKNSTVIKFRREKSMEFDPDTRFINNINDDINNNHSNFETTDEMIKLESANSSRTSSIDEDPRLTIQISSSSPPSQQISSPSTIIYLIFLFRQNCFCVFFFASAFSIPMEQAISIPSNRRSIRPLSTRRIAGEHDQTSSSTNPNEPDPNVFLISSDTNSHNTIRKTKHDVKRFVMYIDEQFSEQKPLHTLSAESLCRYLKHYFENTKKFDGTQYEPDTLRSFLLSIERYLKSKKYEYNLMESPLFQSCRQVIMSKREQWRKMGGGNHSNNHHSSKSSTTILNIKNLTVFDRTKPDGLLLEIYVHITKLCQEKNFSISQLLWGDVALIDEQYLVCHQQKPEKQTIRFKKKNTKIIRIYLILFLDSMQHQVNYQHVQYKLIVFMQRIDHHNAIHLNHHFFLCHVLQIFIIFGIKQLQPVKILNKFFKMHFLNNHLRYQISNLKNVHHQHLIILIHEYHHRVY